MTALLAIDAPHFYAGIVVRDGIVIEAAPILRWTVGRRLWDVQAYFFRKGWSIVVAPEPHDG